MEISKCLSQCVAGRVNLELVNLAQAAEYLNPMRATGESIDHEKLVGELSIESDLQVHEKLCSHTFRSLCPVTNQPDWASILVEYRGTKISRSGLLAYLRGYAEHDGFHESCVELIYRDIRSLEGIEEVAVCAKFLRRGGIDICPFRTSTIDFVEPKGRLIRQ